LLKLNSTFRQCYHRYNHHHHITLC